MHVKEKHSSLLGPFVGYSCKKFYSIVNQSGMRLKEAYPTNGTKSLGLKRREG
jgi:hypothetical protein